MRPVSSIIEDMANPEHLALVRSGVEALNSFALEHENVALDLEEADLRGARLGTLGVGSQRMCISPASFEEVRWDRDELERILSLINLNPDWKVRYELVLRAGG